MKTRTKQKLDRDISAHLTSSASESDQAAKREAGYVLADSVAELDVPEKGLGTAIHELFKPFGGVELEIPPREPMREPPDLT